MADQIAPYLGAIVGIILAVYMHYKFAQMVENTPRGWRNTIRHYIVGPHHADTEAHHASNWAWGLISVAASIVVTVVAALKRDPRFLFLVAWPLFALGVWKISKSIRYRYAARWVFLIVSSAAGIGLIYLGRWLKPPDLAPKQAPAPTPSLTQKVSPNEKSGPSGTPTVGTTPDASSHPKGGAPPSASTPKVATGGEPPLTKKDLDDAIERLRSEMRPGLRSLLLPANDPTPPNACDNYPAANNSQMKLVLAGPMTTAYAPRKTPFAIVRIRNEDLLQVESAPGGVVINATIRDETGQLIEMITKNILHTYSPNDYQLTSDEHSLLILNSHDQIVLYVRYLNPRALKVLGIFESPLRGLVRVEESSVTLNGSRLDIGGICQLDDAPEGSNFRLQAAIVIQ
jgi:hypothetical protein